jgi:hypothetical protein
VLAVLSTIRGIDATVVIVEGHSSQSPAFMHHNRRDVFLQLLFSINIP